MPGLPATGADGTGDVFATLDVSPLLCTGSLRT